jgi:Ran GTPase-activating protein (RanGAP) involved in mRNA processing and transport
LKFNFLNTHASLTLSNALTVNRSLVKLDLSNNGLSPLSGIYFMRNLKDNIFLTDLNLSRNGLNDDFAKELADCLRVNDVL